MLFNPYILAPILLIAVFLYKNKSRVSTFVNIIIVGLYIMALYKQVTWTEYGSYYLRYVFIGLYLGSVTPSLRRFSKLQWVAKMNSRKWILLIIQLILLPLSLYYYSLAYFAQKDFQQNITIVDLEFPLKNGTYYISQGGTSVFNYHSYETEKFAIDIVKLNMMGRMWEGKIFEPKLNNFHNIFTDTIYSPCDGVVLSTENYYNDHPPGELENYINSKPNIIEIGCDNSIRIVLAHLLKNSIMVNIGDTISTGQPIGLVGNSGYSKIPHLHIHAYSTFINSKGLQGKSIAISFDNKILEKNDMIKK